MTSVHPPDGFMATCSNCEAWNRVPERLIQGKGHCGRANQKGAPLQAFSITDDPVLLTAPDFFCAAWSADSETARAIANPKAN